MKTIKLLFLLLIMGFAAFAQTPLSLTGATVSENFDGGSLDNGAGSSLNTFPTGWGLVEQGTGSNANGFYRADDGSSNTGDGRSYGVSASQERAFGGLASGTVQPWIGFAFTNNTGNTITQMNISYIGEQWRAGDASIVEDTLYFAYSLNATSLDDTNATWVYMSSLDFISPNPTGGAATGALDGNNPVNQTAIMGSIIHSVPNGSTVRFRWQDVNIAGVDDGLAIDNFVMSVATNGGPLPPVLSNTTPADNAANVLVSTSSLSLTLDNAITAIGTGGMVKLYNLTNASSVVIPSVDITFSGATATMSNIVLQSNTDYAVQIDSNVFMTANGTFQGIYDNTTWNFKTENTAPPTPVTSLNETFTGCNNPNFGVFKAFSVNGAQDWRCSTFGNNDSNAVRMNGFSNMQVYDNEDWLISPPLDFSAMATPHLHFWSKLRYSGNNTKELMVSTNYTGLGSPAAATWTPLTINNWTSLDTISWKQFSNTDLTSYKSGIFHIAFKYESFATGTADEWSIDDVSVTNGPVSVRSFASQDLSIIVLGDVTNVLNLQIAANTQSDLNFKILDIAGRTVSTHKLTATQGTEHYAVPTIGLVNGLYILQIQNDKELASIKFVVR